MRQLDINKLLSLHSSTQVIVKEHSVYHNAIYIRGSFVDDLTMYKWDIGMYDIMREGVENGLLTGRFTQECEWFIWEIA